MAQGEGLYLFEGVNLAGGWWRSNVRVFDWRDGWWGRRMSAGGLEGFKMMS
jgi:hypothetical protein